MCVILENWGPRKSEISETLIPVWQQNIKDWKLGTLQSIADAMVEYQQYSRNRSMDFKCKL